MHPSMRSYVSSPIENPSCVYHCQVYTIAEDYYKGKPERIGAVGLEILYYYVPEGTVYMDSQSSQKRLIEHIMRDETDYDLMGKITSQ